MSNRLQEETSPYLLQHAENPVDWYPWCEEAFDKARAEDKPVFLSIGYSSCHWCHVMARESFENEEIARILNQHFVCVKVDREERPDIDSVYMSVCQELSGNGGWPLSIFMNAAQEPFFAGTYFPPVSRHGMIGFRDLLTSIVKKWNNAKNELTESARQIVEQMNSRNERQAYEENTEINSSLPAQAVMHFAGCFDALCGGFGQAPKFPSPHNLLFLMLYSYLKREDAVLKQKDMVLAQVSLTLEQMRRGGIFDHIGHGFSRYSTDRYYLVPHFEKMLYDNALLIIAYALAYRLTNNPVFLNTAQKTAAYLTREMEAENGGFYSAQDADSEGAEGKFYIWSYDEICSVLGEKKGGQFCEYYGVTKQGNFEGENIPNLLNGNKISDIFEKERAKLYEYRQSRSRLHLDDKILTSWNALTVSALSILYRVTGETEYLNTAKKTQQFIDKNLSEQNTLYVSWRGGVRSVKGFLDEYAYETAALINLYEACADIAYLKRAGKICLEAEKQFADENGGYFLYGSQNDSLITRPKETYDGAIPSGNSVMAYCLVRLSQLLQPKSESSAAYYRKRAEKQLSFLSAEASSYPAGHSMFLTAMLYYFYPPQKITVVLSEKDTAESIIAKLPFLADVAILAKETEEYKLLDGKTTYYICKDHTCFPPTNQAPFFHKNIT
ncbi:MAG: thioredoxin domain-containing protein [Bacillus sp. (in: Bacteria)]|nr:thioredoxin domain-containing protein [Bacillus sp. (in: firmicutes)]MCM1426705.1 thioredoxin domain-containing protein [Eubacterium sp.]